MTPHGIGTSSNDITSSDLLYLALVSKSSTWQSSLKNRTQAYSCIVILAMMKCAIATCWWRPSSTTSCYSRVWAAQIGDTEVALEMFQGVDQHRCHFYDG